MANTEKSSIAGQRGKTVVARLSPGTDLITGIAKVCDENEISNAVIVSMIGSLQHADIIYVVPDSQAKIGVRYVDPTRIDGPLELLSGQGMIGQTSDAQLSIHLHGIISNAKMKIYGGHFIEGGAPVLATAEICIQEIEAVAMVRLFDTQTGFEMFKLFDSFPEP